MIKKTKLTAALLTAAMVLQLAACGSNTASGTENTSDNGATAATETVAASESTESVDTETAATEDTGTHTVVDHAGNTVEVPNHITRVIIDQIPILSTYMSYFGGEAPYIVGYCGSFKDTISKTVLKNIAPELMESADTVYAQSDLNIEEIMKLEPDVILYNAGNTAHAEILQESGIPCIGFATVGHETEADPLNRYKQWLDLLEDVFGEEGKTDAFTAAGDEIVADVEARIAAVPEDERPERTDSVEIQRRRTAGIRQRNLRYLLDETLRCHGRCRGGNRLYTGEHGTDLRLESGYSVCRRPGTHRSYLGGRAGEQGRGNRFLLHQSCSGRTCL